MKSYTISVGQIGHGYHATINGTVAPLFDAPFAALDSLSAMDTHPTPDGAAHDAVLLLLAAQAAHIPNLRLSL